MMLDRDERRQACSLRRSYSGPTWSPSLLVTRSIPYNYTPLLHACVTIDYDNPVSIAGGGSASGSCAVYTLMPSQTMRSVLCEPDVLPALLLLAMTAAAGWGESLRIIIH